LNHTFLNKDKKYNFALAFVIIGSVLLRFGLANFNREANDYHMPVIRQIMAKDRLPEKEDCSECFQPKFFYYIMAKSLSIMRLDHGRDRDAQVVTLQFINMAAGIITLIVSWLLIARFANINQGAKVLGFSLLAFNPQFIGITSQVTNDSLMIMFCTLLIFCTYLFLKSPNLSYFLLMVAFGVLAILTKTNGWVNVIAVAGTMMIWIIFNPSRIDTIKRFFYLAGFVIAVVSLVILSPLSQYVQNYQKYGSPVALNIDPLPPPKLFDKTYPDGAGILSVWDGYFTFKLGSLLKEPVIPVEDKIDEDSSTTSLWTRLYASASSIHYENYPPSWRPFDTAFYWVYRGNYILALLPAAIMLFYAALEIYWIIKDVFTRNYQLLHEISYGLFTVVFIGQILFVMLYAYEYRIQSVMKAIFIYPALLSMFLFFSRGKTRLSTYLKSFNLTETIVSSAMVILLFFYIVDIATLILQLRPNGSGINLVAVSLIKAWH